jgi:hypothetical protein
MNAFKKMVETDNKNVFLNASEFAEPHTIIYNGVTYSEIPVLLTKVKEVDRQAPTADHAQGLYRVTSILHVALPDMDRIIPEKGQRIKIDDGEAMGNPYFTEHTIASSSCEMGMICQELEAIDE